MIFTILQSFDKHSPTALHEFTLITHHEDFSTGFTANFIDFQRFIGFRKSTPESNGKFEGF